MKKISLLILIFTVLILQACTTYQYSIRNSKIPVSFSDEKSSTGKSRFFKIEKKVSWLFFDLWNIQTFDLSETIKQELPNAKRIYNLRITSEEGPLDSFIRFVSTGAQVWAFVSNRPLLFSRRTIVITGDVEED